MNDRKLYEQILGIPQPWCVDEVTLRLDKGEIEVHVRGTAAVEKCPECGKSCARYDSDERRWRHLDTCQYRTILVATVPRIECDEHGVKQVRVPWADERSRFTALFERLVIDWLQATESIAAVAKGLRLSWDEVAGIRSRAVARGMRRRMKHLGDAVDKGAGASIEPCVPPATTGWPRRDICGSPILSG